MRYLINNLFSKSGRQFLKYIVIGLKSTTINYLFYILIYNVYGNIFFASLVGYSSGIINSYIFGKKWVFKSYEANRLSIIIKFLIVHFSGVVLFTFFIKILTFGEIDYRVAWCIAIIFATLNNFFGSKYLVFKK